MRNHLSTCIKSNTTIIIYLLIFLIFSIGFAANSAKKEPEFYESVGIYLDEASKISGLTQSTLDHIKAPDTSLTFTFPIEVIILKTKLI